MNTSTTVRKLRRFCAFIIGAVFLMAGLFKLLDPTGAGLVMEGYFRFFRTGFLIPAAKAAAVILALLEAIAGAALISGIWRKQVAIVTTVMIGFFTVLTLFLAVFNPVELTDCGCFGEAIHLTNLQTFLKNIILLALDLAAFLPFKDFGENKKRKYASFAIVAASIFGFAILSLTGIPAVDYTEFSPGSELMASGGDDADGRQGYYKSTIIYEKNGQEGAFDLDRLPDSTWNYVRTETIFINGADVEDNTPNLSFRDSLGEYRDKMATVGNVLAVSVPSPSGLNGGKWTAIADVLDGAAAAGFTPLLLAGSSKEAIDSLETIVPAVRSRLERSMYYADTKTLVTLNRSNGGATWFNDGQLIRKYSFGSLPDADALLEMTGDDPTEEMLKYSTKGRLRFQGFVLYVFAILLIL